MTTRLSKMRARRALELQTELSNARRIRQPIATLLTAWRKVHRRIGRAADRLNGMLDEPIEVELLPPAEVLGQLQPLLEGPSAAFVELRSRGRAIAKQEPARMRKAKAELKRFHGHLAAIETALNDPEKLKYRFEASNELRRYEGKAPVSLDEFTTVLRSQLERCDKLRRRANGD